MPRWMDHPLRVASLVLVPFVMSAQADDQEEPPRYPPTSCYEVRDIEGWTVLVHEDFLGDHPELAARTLELLRVQLYQIIRRVPAEAVETLRLIRIWVEEDEPNHPCMAYHPDAHWLREHGMNPEKAGCIEVANARNFLDWTLAQPWMVLHELAHGYHHRFLDDGFDNAAIKGVFERARQEGRYDSVLHINGKDERAYALVNPMEYFAEATEAFFGTNDFYPFVRSELQRHDPEMDELLRSIWMVPGRSTR
ncbi:hypothetical protein [Tautonia marina]|uniref:hypothetical protein n=1 Tax=Tautonia marina TaxID=2653855 RepID=UPI0012609205|nr:hypothetical protein [Tautonia marina]